MLVRTGAPTTQKRGSDSDETLTAHYSIVAGPLLNMRTPSMPLYFKLDVGFVDVVVVSGHFTVEYRGYWHCCQKSLRFKLGVNSL